MHPVPLPDAWRVCVITDERLARGRSNVEIARAAVAGGADAVQLRDKTADSRKLYEDGLAIRRLTAEAGVAFIVNDRPDIALAVDADGVHVGDRDLPPAEARRIIGPERLLGVSVPDARLAERLRQERVDYLGVGPVFEARATKADAGEPQGLDLLRTLRRSTPLPLLAIGGITHRNAAEVIRAGATGVAVISAVVAAEDIAAATRELKAAVLVARGGSGSAGNPGGGAENRSSEGGLR